MIIRGEIQYQRDISLLPPSVFLYFLQDWSSQDQQMVVQTHLLHNKWERHTWLMIAALYLKKWQGTWLAGKYPPALWKSLLLIMLYVWYRSKSWRRLSNGSMTFVFGLAQMNLSKRFTSLRLCKQLIRMRGQVHLHDAYFIIWFYLWVTIICLGNDICHLVDDGCKGTLFFNWTV